MVVKGFEKEREVSYPNEGNKKIPIFGHLRVKRSIKEHACNRSNVSGAIPSPARSWL